MVALPRAMAAIALLFAAVPPSATAASAQAAAAVDRAAEEAAERTALDAATRDLCGRQIVLLGENGFHGDGRTAAFKAALIRRLIRRCRFNAVFFEASHYDFLAIAQRLRTRQAITPVMVSSAIGWMWNQDEEIAPLIALLFEEAQAGRITLGGLDDQLGSRGAFYSLEQMPADLASYLAGDRREECRRLIRQRIWSAYPRNAPYDAAARGRIGQCLAEIRSALAAAERGDPAKRDEVLEMIANIERTMARDFDEGSRRLWDRDHSMFLNLQWLAGRLPPRSRIIVWSENTHVARDASASELFAGGRNLGSYVRQAYGARAFALGFTAASGSFRYAVGTSRPIAAAPPESLEARAIAGTDSEAVYLGPARLARLGPISAGAFGGHQQLRARWADIYDGMLVFRAERPPRRIGESGPAKAGR
jgi:erythromycin esterase-like protein